MITPELLDQFLAVLQRRNAMSAQIESDPSGHDKITVTLAPQFESTAQAGDPEPGGWKSQPSDPHDPDPLGLGMLDAPLAFDPDPTEPSDAVLE